MRIQKKDYVDYNTFMRSTTNIVRLLRIAAGLWLAYLGVSATIDYTLKSPGPVEMFFYIADGGIAVFFLGISFWSKIQKRLGKVFLPLMIILICVLPIIVNQIVVRYLFPDPLPPPEAMLSRVVPFLLIALLLIAWQYKWQHILIFGLAIALFNISILWAFTDNRAAFSAGLFAIMTQVVTFLVVGFFINIMVGWLHSQRRSLEEANSKLTNYAQTLENLAISRESNRIAQELHDTLSHTLSGLSVQLETMKAYWDIDPLTARKRLDKSLAATRSGLEETRRILMALRAKPLEDLGLVLSIRQMAEEAATRSGIMLDMVITDNIPALPPDVEQCIYRVTQEAITNVLKHARAKMLTIKLECKENKVTLLVRDNGVGFDIAANSGNKHFGLLGMKERVEFVNGELSITSQPGHGTTVQLTV
ncbi:MAG: sensor histidine kinase [Chloroflexi bacterium]|nr:sensor histidine kinase [Chloroflexota bacterium]